MDTSTSDTGTNTMYHVRTYIHMYVHVCRYTHTHTHAGTSTCTMYHTEYRIRFNFRGVKLSRFTSFCNFHIFTFAVAESQAGEIKPCVSFRGVTLSWMVADPRKPQKLKPIGYAHMQKCMHTYMQAHTYTHTSFTHAYTHTHTYPQRLTMKSGCTRRVAARRDTHTKPVRNWSDNSPKAKK